MIYLDNSATSYPKPYNLSKVYKKFMNLYGSNVGRSSYSMAMRTSEMVYNCRIKISKLFNSKPENVIFTNNCTMAINMSIKGIASKNSHFIISDIEHNAVVRPLQTLKIKGICDYSIAKIDKNKEKTIENFKKCINDKTKAIICTGASNVFGIIPPVSEIGKLAKNNNLLFINDAAQTAGSYDIDIKKQKIDILCCAGHKGLFSPTGIGLIILNNNINLETIIEGGTGSNSLSLIQPNYYPDRLESGTLNTFGIYGLSNGIDYINKTKINNIFNYKSTIIKNIFNELKNINHLNCYQNLNDFNNSTVLSFNIDKLQSEQTAELLANENICVRAGLHCAPLAHKKIGTLSSGTVRVSPSCFTKNYEIKKLINSINKIAKSK